MITILWDKNNALGIGFVRDVFLIIMENENTVIPSILITENNHYFRGYIPIEEVARIQQTQDATTVILRETPEKLVPNYIKEGQEIIKDIWVTLVPGPDFQG